MATPRFEGGASPVAEERTYLFGGTWEASDVVRMQIGNKVYDFEPNSAVTNTVVSALDALIDALDETVYPEITSDESGVTASSSTATLTLTANEPGVPFTCTLTPLESDLSAADAQTIEGAGTATTGTALTANSGPEVWSTAANWDTGIAPTTGDTFHIDNYDGDILYGLSAAGATVAAGHIWQSFTGRIGLPKENDLGTPYPEYRTEYLTLDCSLWHIGAGPGSGSERIKINSGSVQTAVHVHNTGSAEDAGLEAFLWKGTHASNVMNVRGDASVGVAVFGAETAVIATLTVGQNAHVRCGDGTTLTTINLYDNAELIVSSAIGGTVTMDGGRLEVNKAATAAQLTLRGGVTEYNSTGTVSGNTVLTGNAVLDFSKGVGAVAVTNPIELYGPNCRIIDPDKRVTTLVVDFNEGADESQVSWGRNVRLTRGTPA